MAASRAQRRHRSFVVTNGQPDLVLAKAGVLGDWFGYGWHGLRDLAHNPVNHIAGGQRESAIDQDTLEFFFGHRRLQQQQGAQLRIAILLDDKKMI